MGTVTVAAYTRAGVLVDTLALSLRRGWQHPHNDVGSGHATLPYGDPAIALVDFDHVLRFFVDGVARFSALVATKKLSTVAPGEEASQTVELHGPGTLAVWDEAVVWPELGLDSARFSDVRLFNFANPSLVDTAWTAAVVTAASHFGGPDGWPDATASWIWDQDSSVSVPVGDVYFRKTFNAASAQNVDISAAADDAYELWLDGVRILEDGFDVGYLGQMKRIRVALDAGSHVLAARARNGAVKAGLRVSVQTLDAAGAPVATLVKTDATWKTLGYPADPPGFTVGRVIRLLLAEAQARGALTDVAVGFTDTLDSDGVAWTSTPDISLDVGRSYLAVLLQFAEAHCDIAMRAASLTLDAWVVRGADTAVALESTGTKATSNLLELIHEGKSA